MDGHLQGNCLSGDRQKCDLLRTTGLTCSLLYLLSACCCISSVLSYAPVLFHRSSGAPALSCVPMWYPPPSFGVHPIRGRLLRNEHSIGPVTYVKRQSTVQQTPEHVPHYLYLCRCPHDMATPCTPKTRRRSTHSPSLGRAWLTSGRNSWAQGVGVWGVGGGGGRLQVP
jgi:hypothetical protein